MKVYLDEPVELYGIKINHTYEGTKHLIDHYSHILKIARPDQMDDKARSHCAQVIENLKIHQALYEKHFEEKQHENNCQSHPGPARQ